MTFATIKTAVQGTLIDLPSSTLARIGDWVNLAIRDGEGRHNFHHMAAVASFVTTEGARKLGDLPALWKERRGLPWLVDASGYRREITWASSDNELVRRFGVSATVDIGEPKAIQVTPGDELHVYPYPDGLSLYGDGDYRVEVPYWARSAELSGDSDTNWWTTNARDYVELFAAARGFEFNENMQQADRYIVRAEAQFRAARRQDKLRKVDTHTTLAFRSGAAGTRASKGL